MLGKARIRLSGKGRDTYLDLIQQFPLASIQSEDHLRTAQQVIDRLLTEGKLDSGAEMYLDALSDLVATYEDEQHPIPPASDADLLRHLMETRGVSQAQVSRETGLSKSTISEVLTGKKPFSRSMIRKLAEYFHVDLTLLVANL